MKRMRYVIVDLESSQYICNLCLREWNHECTCNKKNNVKEKKQEEKSITLKCQRNKMLKIRNNFIRTEDGTWLNMRMIMSFVIDDGKIWSMYEDGSEHLLFAPKDDDINLQSILDEVMVT